MSPSPTPTAANLFLHVDVSGNLEKSGSGFAEYETDARFWMVEPDGSFEPFVPIPPSSSPFSRFIFAAGSHHDVFDVDLPPVPFGTPLLMDNGFLFDLAIASGGAQFLSDATAEVSLCSHDANVALTSASGSIGNCPTNGDVSVVSAEPVQSVFGASRLIAGKDTVIAVDLANTNPVPAEVTVEWSIQQGGAPDVFTEEVTVPANCAAKRIYLPDPDTSLMNVCSVPSEPLGSLLSLGLVPIDGAPYRVGLQLHASFAVDPDKTNDAFGESLPVKRTQFAPMFTQIECVSGNCVPGYGAIAADEFHDALAWGDTQTLAMFPVGILGGFEPSVCLNPDGSDCAVLGDEDQCRPDLGDCPGIIADVLETRMILKAVNPAGASAFAAYVPGGYFFYHGYGSAGDAIGTAGLTILSIDGGDPISLIRADLVAGSSPLVRGHLSTTPHELMHGLRYDNSHTSDPAQGFWVGCPNGPCNAGPRNLMEPTSGEEPPTTWIDVGDYELALNELKVLPDPTILDITGTVTRDGTVTLKSVVEFPEGRVTSSKGGTGFSVVVLDANGVILAEHDGPENFDRPTSDPNPRPWNTLPLALSIEYPPSAMAVEFRRGSTVLLRIDPLAWTLRTEIEALPDRAFEKNPKERRAALLAKVDALELMLANKAYKGVLGDLQGDLRDKLEKWVVADYPHQQVLESTQTSVLAQIDRVVDRVKTLQANQSRGGGK